MVLVTGSAVSVYRSKGGQGSSFSSSAGEEFDFHVQVLHRSPSSPSCEHEAAENGDFPSAVKPTTESKGLPAPGGSRGGGAAARPRSASELLGCSISKDSVVIFIFCGVCCTLHVG